MVFGNPANEHLQLNKDDFWAGSPYTNANPNGGKAALQKIQQLISAGKYKEAIADFDQAIKLKITNTAIYTQRGIAKSESGDAKGAIRANADEIDPATASQT